ncbi:MAG: T9SS type A sorting domain-containing protein [Chitinophagales bacterium]|nr:T9SS type A sorting domain-containing protein [Chitinophagales bacterium]
MKNITLSICISLCSIAVFAQQVSSIAIIPSPAAAGANLQAVVTTVFPGGPCSYVSSFPMTISNDTIIFDAIYCYESDGPESCNTTDTFDIGQLNVGEYTVRFKLTSTNAGGPCGQQTYQLKDIGLHDFGVVLGSGITQVNTARVQLSPNPITDRVRFTLENSTGTVEITLLDISGKVLQAATFTAGEQLTMDVSALPANVYFYTLKTATQTASGKLVIAD